MPTQEDINAANVELQIANDNYAQLADRYNKYQKLFQEYASASPEVQDRATEAMWRALEDYYQLQDKMRAAEDRIAVAQNAVNSYNEIMAQQPTVRQTTNVATRRREVPTTTIIPEAQQLIPNWMSTAQWEVPWYTNTRPTQTVRWINPTLDRLSEQQYVNNYRTQPNINPWIVNTNLWLSWNISAAPAVPYEIQNVRWLRWDAYLQWLNNLQNNYWYNVIGQRAYRNGNSYRTY